MASLEQRNLFANLSLYYTDMKENESNRSRLTQELTNYVLVNMNDKKALTMLTAYLYVNMDEEFNQFFIEEIIYYISPDKEMENLNLIYNLENDLRDYSSGKNKGSYYNGTVP